VTIHNKTQEASYLVTELVAKQMIPHTIYSAIAENPILPACRNF